jgi:signal transduction histidine kinase
VAWLRARYTDPATWREVGYACLLATVAPVLSIAALLAAPLTGSFIASPFLVLAQRPGDGPVALAFGKVATVGQALPYVIAGVLLLPLVPYLLTLLAGAHAAVARALLLGGSAAQLRTELVEVSRSRVRLADAFEAERRRIERDLHDGAQQRLVGLTLQLGLARLDLPPGSPAAETVAAAHQQAKQLMAELRELIHGIQPQVLTDLGLPAAIGELADQSPIPVAVDARLPGRLPSQIENTAYFVAAEALTNIAKHSGATSASVTARQHDNLLTIEVSDNGHGGADPHRRSGLTGLADRVAVTGGRMLLSSPDGGPTLLRVEFPCTQSQPPSG